MVDDATPCRWSAHLGDVELHEARLVDLPPEEQVARGQELLRILWETPAPQAAVSSSSSGSGSGRKGDLQPLVAAASSRSTVETPTADGKEWSDCSTDVPSDHEDGVAPALCGGRKGYVSSPGAPSVASSDDRDEQPLLDPYAWAWPGLLLPPPPAPYQAPPLASSLQALPQTLLPELALQELFAAQAPPDGSALAFARAAAAQRALLAVAYKQGGMHYPLASAPPPPRFPPPLPPALYAQPFGSLSPAPGLQTAMPWRQQPLQLSLGPLV